MGRWEDLNAQQSVWVDYHEELKQYFAGLCIKSSLEFGLLCLVTQSCLTLCDPMDYSLPGSSVHGISQARTGVGCHFLLQGIFLSQGSKLGLLHWQAILYHLSHQGSPELLQSSSEIISYFGSSLLRIHRRRHHEGIRQRYSKLRRQKNAHRIYR